MKAAFQECCCQPGTKICLNFNGKRKKYQDWKNAFTASEQNSRIALKMQVRRGDR